jgi:hypothetical protein
MHVYLRWYENNQPKTSPQRMESESAAIAAVRERFPLVTFSERVRTTNQPTGAMLSGIDEMKFAWSGPKAPGSKPVADILFPAG